MIYVKVVGGYSGAYKERGRWRTFECVRCFLHAHRHLVPKLVPMTQAASDRIRLRTGWDQACGGAEAHRRIMGC